MRVGSSLPGLKPNPRNLAERPDGPIYHEALRLWKAGLNVLPITLDGRKRPDLREWKLFQKTRLPLHRVRGAFANEDAGLCIIGGSTSGNAEGLDFDNHDGRLGDTFDRWKALVPPALYARLAVYTSPAGGYRVMYRRMAGTGSYVERLARIDARETLIELLGEGHIILVPGGHADAHQTGLPYTMIQGDLAELVELTPAERDTLIEAAKAFNRYTPPPKPPRTALDDEDDEERKPVGDRPGDDFNTRAKWSDILEPHGWSLEYSGGDQQYWCRPGKDRGISASTNHMGSDLLHVWSTNADPFEPDTSYSKFAAYGLLVHGGDFVAAARSLAGQGYGKARIAPPPRPATAEAIEKVSNGQERPEIGITGKQLPALTAEAEAALAAANQPPRLFRRGGAVVRLGSHTVGGRPLLETLCLDGLRGELARAADWVSYRKDGAVAAYPPEVVVRDLLSRSDWKLPNLKGVVETPVFAAGGRLVSMPGYDEDSGLWYHPAPGLDLPEVAERPGPDDIRRARELLLDDLLGDFPLADDASRANVLALLLLPFARPLIDGPTPLHVVNAPTERTGKTLLAKCFAAVASGRGLDDSSKCGSDEEWKKTLTSLLSDGPSYVCFDNLSAPLHSATLAKVLTDRVHQDRVLGRNDLVRRLPVECVWLATGNNVRASKEIAGRTVLVELDAWLENPQLRDDFRHPLPGWALENRGRLVGACLTLCRAWVAAGMPAGRQVMGGFEAWVRTMGGILDVAGVAGFLGNRDKVLAEVNSSDGEWREAVGLWWETFQARPVSAADLAHLLVGRGLLLATFDRCRDEYDRARRLGMALNRMVHRIYAGLRIEKGTDAHKKSNTYRLVQVSAKGPEDAGTREGSAGTSAGTPPTTPRTPKPSTASTCGGLRGLRGLSSNHEEGEEKEREYAHAGRKEPAESPHSPQVVGKTDRSVACGGGSPAGSAGTPSLPELTRGVIPYDLPYEVEWHQGRRGESWPSVRLALTKEEFDALDIDARRAHIDWGGGIYSFRFPEGLAFGGGQPQAAALAGPVRDPCKEG